MTKPRGKGDPGITSRYMQMAEAAAKGAQNARSARDKAVYLALAKGWEGLAEDSALRAKKAKPARGATKKPKPGGAG